MTEISRAGLSLLVGDDGGQDVDPAACPDAEPILRLCRRARTADGRVAQIDVLAFDLEAPGGPVFLIDGDGGYSEDDWSIWEVDGIKFFIRVRA